MPKSIKPTPAQYLNRLLGLFPKRPRLTAKLQESLLAGLAFSRRINNRGGASYDLMQGLISARSVAVPVLDSAGVNITKFSRQLRADAISFVEGDRSDSRWVEGYEDFSTRLFANEASCTLKVAQLLADTRRLGAIDTSCFLEALFKTELNEKRRLSRSDVEQLAHTPWANQIRDMLRAHSLEENTFETLGDIGSALNDRHTFLYSIFDGLSKQMRSLSDLDRMEYTVQFSKNMEPFIEESRLVLLPGADQRIHIRQFDYGNTYVARDRGHLAGCKLNLCSGGGVITWRDVEAFEFLINRSNISEWDFQRFFEKHPAFLLGSQYYRLHSQVVLLGADGKELIPDFFAERVGTTFADIIELKTPSAKLTSGSQGRRGFAASLSRALNQVRTYRNFFDNPSRRRQFHQQYGFEAFRPTITVVMARQKKSWVDSGSGNLPSE